MQREKEELSDIIYPNNEFRERFRKVRIDIDTLANDFYNSTTPNDKIEVKLREEEEAPVLKTNLYLSLFRLKGPIKLVGEIEFIRPPSPKNIYEEGLKFKIENVDFRERFCGLMSKNNASDIIPFEINEDVLFIKESNFSKNDKLYMNTYFLLFKTPDIMIEVPKEENEEEHELYDPRTVDTFPTQTEEKPLREKREIKLTKDYVDERIRNVQYYLHELGTPISKTKIMLEENLLDLTVQNTLLLKQYRTKGLIKIEGYIKFLQNSSRVQFKMENVNFGESFRGIVLTHSEQGTWKWHTKYIFNFENDVLHIYTNGETFSKDDTLYFNDIFMLTEVPKLTKIL